MGCGWGCRGVCSAAADLSSETTRDAERVQAEPAPYASVPPKSYHLHSEAFKDLKGLKGTKRD